MKRTIVINDKEHHKALMLFKELVMQVEHSVFNSLSSQEIKDSYATLSRITSKAGKFLVNVDRKLKSEN